MITSLAPNDAYATLRGTGFCSQVTRHVLPVNGHSSALCDFFSFGFCIFVGRVCIKIYIL
jgi:hypothetical protein